jgi:hypothetical protein
VAPCDLYIHADDYARAGIETGKQRFCNTGNSARTLAGFLKMARYGVLGYTTVYSEECDADEVVNACGVPVD